MNIILFYFLFVLYLSDLNFGDTCKELFYNKCTRDSECCSQYCHINPYNSRGLCSPAENKPNVTVTSRTENNDNNNNCFPLNYNKCRRDDDCCSKKCDIKPYQILGICNEKKESSTSLIIDARTNLDSCKPTHYNKCTKDEDCCSKNCYKEQFNKYGICNLEKTKNPRCNINGLRCTVNSDCCSQYCFNGDCQNFIYSTTRPTTRSTTASDVDTNFQTSTSKCGVRGKAFDIIDEASDDETVRFGVDNAKKGQYPWMVSFQKGKRGRNYRHFCSGAMISSKHILTAAHCFQSPDTNNIIAVTNVVNLKDTNKKDWRIDKIFNHPNYSSTKHNNDIAVIKLLDNINPINRESQFPICFPYEGVHVSNGDVVHVSGWASGQILKDYTIAIANNIVCGVSYEEFFTKDMICASSYSGQTDACKGDSGGPLMKSYEGIVTMFGIVSFGQGCASGGLKPGVYTKVSNYYNWIKEMMSK